MRSRRADIDTDRRQRDIVLTPQRIVLDRTVVDLDIVVVIVVGVVGMHMHDVAAIEVVGERVAGLLVVVVGHSVNLQGGVNLAAGFAGQYRRRAAGLEPRQ